jgi:hypothetical protein
MAKVETVRADYNEAKPKWKRCRDAYGGTDPVKAARAEYLPQLSGQSADEYAAYLTRAEWFGATERTINGLTGAVFRKDPTVEAPEAVTRDDFKDLTLGGVSFAAFARQAFTEILIVGRGGVLVDMPMKAGVNGRPYWVWYRAEQIVNWRTVSVDGDQRLVLVVIKEEVETPDAVDPFVMKASDQYRVLRLVASLVVPAMFRYEVTLYTRPDAKGEYVAGEPTYPMRRGVSLDFIPFVFLGPEDITPTVRKPPCLDLADTNLSHYRTSGDYEHGLHFCALPTPVIFGKVDGAIKLGSGTALVVPPEPGVDVKMLEFTGQGLGALEQAMDRKEQRMAVLGARLLEHQKREAEAAETLKIRQSGDQSTLAKVAHAVSQAFTFATQVHTWWRSATQDTFDPKVSVTLNQDFVGVQLSAEEVKALMLIWQAGGMSFETFYWKLREGGWTRPDVTPEQEKEAIEAELPEEPEPLPLPEPPVVDPNDPDKQQRPKAA